MKHTISICVGTGRCGTTFLAELAGLESGVAASHERLRLAATFHMFCKWHDIPIDAEGFLCARDQVVQQDLQHHQVSFESNALLSHSIIELYHRFDAKFVLLVRRPDLTVASFAARGWFLEPIAWQDTTKPPTIQDNMQPRHFFGRNLPRGEGFARWSALTQIGRIAWFWQARNKDILKQFSQLPADHCRIMRLEDLSYANYCTLAEFLGWQVSIGESQYQKLVEQKPNAGPNPPLNPDFWDNTAIHEFETEVEQIATTLGYEFRIQNLLRGQPVLLTTNPPIANQALIKLA